PGESQHRRVGPNGRTNTEHPLVRKRKGRPKAPFRRHGYQDSERALALLMAVVKVAAAGARGTAQGRTAQHAAAGRTADQRTGAGTDAGTRQGMPRRVAHAVTARGCDSEGRNKTKGR